MKCFCCRLRDGGGKQKHRYTNETLFSLLRMVLLISVCSTVSWSRFVGASYSFDSASRSICLAVDCLVLALAGFFAFVGTKKGNYGLRIFYKENETLLLHSFP